MKPKTKPHPAGFILIGVLLMLSMGLSTLCLLMAAQNHQHIWRQRMHRLEESRSQQNRLIRISHHLMERLMCTPLPEKEIITDQDYWQSQLEICAEQESGTSTIEADSQILTDNPFDPIQIDLKITLTTQDKQPGMTHRSLLQGRYFSGRFPMGSVPVLLKDSQNTTVPYDSLYSRTTLPRDTFSILEAPSSEPLSWLDPLPLLMSPLGLEGLIPDWPLIGGLIGLDLNGPPPEGVYTIMVQEKLKSLFIFGNVEKMILSEKDGEQVIDLHGTTFRKKFRYKLSPPDCSLSDVLLPPDCQFGQNIVIIGNINSLEQSGEYGLAPFCSLYVYVNGSIRIGSSLQSRPSSPKSPKTGSLILVSAGVLKESLSLPPGIILDSKRGMKLDAHLISTGKIHNSGNQLTINGSISASSFNGQQAIVNHCTPNRELAPGPEIRFFQNLLFWGIEEVFNDE